jgi:PRTRC genetic system protein E
MFKELAPLLRQRSILLSISHREDDILRVNVFPKKLGESENEALTTPLSVAGTAEELDAQFPAALVGYVGVHLGFSSTLQTVKEQVAAAAKAAKDEAKAKATRPAPAKAEPSKPTPATSTVAKAQPAKVDSQPTQTAVAKPAAVKKPDVPQSASLFDFSAPDPAPAAAPLAVSDDEDEDEAAILAEIAEEEAEEADDIAA